MEKILKDDPELAQMLVKHFLVNGDKKRLSKINFVTILHQDLAFAKQLLRSYLDKNNYSNVSLIVDNLLEPAPEPDDLDDSNDPVVKITPKPNSRICSLNDRITEFISVIQKVIDGKHYYHYLDEYQKLVPECNRVRLTKIENVASPFLDMKAFERSMPDFIKHLFLEIQGEVVYDGGTSCLFVACQKQDHQEGEYTICWSIRGLYSRDTFRYLTFNKNGEVIDGKMME